MELTCNTPSQLRRKGTLAPFHNVCTHNVSHVASMAGP